MQISPAHRFVALGVLLCLGILGLAAIATADDSSTPSYTPNGEMIFPSKYREWIYLSSGIDMNYNPKSVAAGTASHSTFDNVFVNPEAYRKFLDTGAWPDKTVLVLELRGAQNKGSINQSGHYQSSARTGMEVHVKDETRFPGGWAFFGFGNDTSGKLFPQSATCYSCHAQHGAVDTTFVQFYPILLGIAEKKGTLSPAYLKELHAVTGTR